MFSEELLGVFVRWSEESDLGELEMAEAAAAVINSYCGDSFLELEDESDEIEFEADPEFLDKLENEEEEE